MKKNRLYSNNILDEFLNNSKKELKKFLFNILREHFLDSDFTESQEISSIKVKIDNDSIILYLKISGIWNEVDDDEIEKFSDLESCRNMLYEYLDVLNFYEIKLIQYNHVRRF